ncbi:g10448 [Coccomyxa elongata]
MSGRPSMFPGTVRLAGPATAVPRRSSTHAKAGGPKHDPRRIGDKAYQANCIRTLIAYLSTHGYDQPLTPKTLTNPMGKDVINIMHFLMRRVDPHSKMDPTTKMDPNSKNPGNQCKIEDEVPALFKRLRYPYTISKSALFAVGSPHTWPGLLAALVWLTELLYYEEKAEQVKEQSFDDKARSETEFFNYVSTAYRHFMSGHDEEGAAVDEAQTRVFHDRVEAAQTRNAELQQERARLAAEIEAMRTGPSPLEEAHAKHQEHVSDRDKFRSLLTNLQSQKEGLQRKVAERTADLRSKQQQLAAVEQENVEMRAKIATQTVSRDDVIRMNQERVKQEQRLRGVATQHESLDARVAEQERACEGRLDDLEGALKTYHTAADRLRLIPASAKRAAGIQYEISLDRSGATPSELINVDLRGVVKAGLVRVKEGHGSRARELAEEELALQEGLDGTRHALSERAEENAALSAQVAQLEEQQAASKVAMEADIRARHEEAKALKAVVDELRNATCNVMGSEAAIVALQIQAEEEVRESEAEAEQLNADLADALQSLLDHKLHLQRTLEHTHSHVHSVLASVAAMPV